MTDVLEFPSQRAQGLAYLERHIRILLEAKGADEQLIDYAAKQLSAAYSELTGTEHYSFSVTLPGKLCPADQNSLYEQINEGLEGIREENHALMVKLVAQLVLTQMQLFQHERNDSR